MKNSQVSKRDWYLVFCKPRQEVIAKTNLDRQGYETFLPLVPKIKRQKGRKVNQLEAMFPRYLFIHLGKGIENWSPIKSTIGVSHLVKFGIEPARVQSKIVENLIKASDENGVIEIPKRQIQPGDKVAIVDGVMAGYEGIMLAKTGKERVRILLSAIDSPFSDFEISEELIELAG